MITQSYTCALYRFAYDIIGLAAQDNIRGTMWEWIECLIGFEVFHDNICRAMSVSPGGKKLIQS
jgi:hypothetical protein